MKREYMKPAVRVVMIQQRHNLLAGSPGGYNGKSISTYRGSGDEVTDSDIEDIF